MKGSRPEGATLYWVATRGSNPILGRDQRERSVGIAKPLLLSVSKTRHIEKYEQESVILCTRAFGIKQVGHEKDLMQQWKWHNVRQDLRPLYIFIIRLLWKMRHPWEGLCTGLGAIFFYFDILKKQKIRRKVFWMEKNVYFCNLKLNRN
jgi:hypothetical protein